MQLIGCQAQEDIKLSHNLGSWHNHITRRMEMSNKLIKHNKFQNSAELKE